MAGACLTFKMAGGALDAAWLLGMPGVPRLAGIGRAPVSSIQLPRTRSKTYGVPRSQRPVSFKVAVEPEPSELAVSADSASLSPVHMPSLERRWSDWELR